MKQAIINTAELIQELYKTEDGAAGGYGHIVFDDDNLEDENIKWCISEAEQGKYGLCEETRQASIKALQAMLQLTEEERAQANDYYWQVSRSGKEFIFHTLDEYIPNEDSTYFKPSTQLYHLTIGKKYLITHTSDGPQITDDRGIQRVVKPLPSEIVS